VLRKVQASTRIGGQKYFRVRICTGIFFSEIDDYRTKIENFKKYEYFCGKFL